MILEQVRWGLSQTKKIFWNSSNNNGRDTNNGDDDDGKGDGNNGISNGDDDDITYDSDMMNMTNIQLSL